MRVRGCWQRVRRGGGIAKRQAQAARTRALPRYLWAAGGESAGRWLPRGRCPQAGRSGTACLAVLTARRPSGGRERVPCALSLTLDQTATLPRVRVTEMTLLESAELNPKLPRACTKGTVAVSPGDHRTLPKLINTFSGLGHCLSRAPKHQGTLTRGFFLSHPLLTQRASRSLLKEFMRN